MRPHKTPDIGWRDLCRGVLVCLAPGGRRMAQAGVENTWHGRAALATLSVRSGLDLLLQQLRLPAGSEVLVSAITIRDMPAILQHHGLRAIPMDLDPRTCAVDARLLDSAVTPRTRAILVAHLFGGRMDMRGIVACARRHGLLLLEDCAQSYTCDGYHGHAGSDVAMFSFGPIKTATALGGGVLCFRDAVLRDACAALQHRWPVQSRRTYLLRLLKYAWIKALCNALPYTVFAALCRWSGRHHDAVISAATRGFAGCDLFTGLRRQPSTPLLSTMAHRLATRDRGRIDARIAAADAFRSCAGMLEPIGGRASPHGHWVFPIASRDPDALVQKLWDAGFDATRGATSLHVVPGPEPGRDDTPMARGIMDSVVYLPLETATPRGIARLARLVIAFEAGRIA